MNNHKQQGFTLVELSIVLVIIGLLIGGILAAQSMITTTKVQALTRQIGQFDAAVGTYVDKYSGMPGDESRVSPDGDNDGLIESATANTMDGERGEFWNDMSTAGLRNEAGTTYTADSGALTTGIPNSKIGTNMGIYIGTDTTTRRNYYRVVGQTSTTIDATLTDLTIGNTSAADALAVDVKMDDGVSTTGSVLNTTDATADAAGVTTAAYGATNRLAIRFGSSTGDVR